MKFTALCLVHLTVVNLMGFVSGGFSQRVREKVLDSAKVVAAPGGPQVTLLSPAPPT